jgi:hypothetical protein
MNIITITQTIDTHIKKIQSIIKKKIDCQEKLKQLQQRIEEINLSKSEEIEKIKEINKLLKEKESKSEQQITSLNTMNKTLNVKFNKIIITNVLDLIQKLHLNSYSLKLFDDILNHIFTIINDYTDYIKLFKTLKIDNIEYDFTLLSKKDFIYKVTEVEEKKKKFNENQNEELLKLEQLQKISANKLKKNEENDIVLFITNVIYISLYPDFELININSDKNLLKNYNDLLFNLYNRCTSNSKELDNIKKNISELENMISTVFEDFLKFKKSILLFKEGLPKKNDDKNLFTKLNELSTIYNYFFPLKNQSNTKKPYEEILKKMLESYINHIKNNNELFFQKIYFKYLEDIDYCEIIESIEKIGPIKEIESIKEI